jgi:hypothetical protein
LKGLKVFIASCFRVLVLSARAGRGHWGAEEEGGWTVTLLEKAVGKLVDKLGVDVEFGWAEANYLHVWGFHEAKLDVEDVKRRIPIIRRLVDLAQET